MKKERERVSACVKEKIREERKREERNSPE